MKTIVGAGLMLAFVTGTALAQTAQQPPPQPAEAHEQQGDARMPPPGPPPGDHEDWDHPDGDMQGRHHRRPPPPPPSKAARFRIEAGDVSIGMKCPEDEPLKGCADFALQLIEKVGALPRH